MLCGFLVTWGLKRSFMCSSVWVNASLMNLFPPLQEGNHDWLIKDVWDHDWWRDVKQSTTKLKCINLFKYLLIKSIKRFRVCVVMCWGCMRFSSVSPGSTAPPAGSLCPVDHMNVWCLMLSENTHFICVIKSSCKPFRPNCTNVHVIFVLEMFSWFVVWFLVVEPPVSLAAFTILLDI